MSFKRIDDYLDYQKCLQLTANLYKPLWYRKFQNLLVLELPPDFIFVYLPEFSAYISEHYLLLK